MSAPERALGFTSQTEVLWMIDGMAALPGAAAPVGWFRPPPEAELAPAEHRLIKECF